MEERNPIDPVLSLSDIVPGNFEPIMPKFGDGNAPARADIDPKSLGLIEEHANLEAMAYKKYTVYSEYISDPELKKTAVKAALKHKQHFDELQNYLGNCCI
jgi:hypothetical protein